MSLFSPYCCKLLSPLRVKWGFLISYSFNKFFVFPETSLNILRWREIWINTLKKKLFVRTLLTIFVLVWDTRYFYNAEKPNNYQNKTNNLLKNHLPVEYRSVSNLLINHQMSAISLENFLPPGNKKFSFIKETNKCLFFSISWKKIMSSLWSK